jgi:dihydrofolate reductase
MRRLVVFNSVTLDGYFTGAAGDMSWAHRAERDAEFDAFVQGNAKSGGVLVFGRVTYDLMASWWPTPAAVKAFPTVAERMNDLPKLVFSRSMQQAAWRNTTLLKGDPAAEIRRIKSEAGADMAILGSGSIVAQLAREGLVDEFQIVLIPVVIGSGRTMFEGVDKKLALRLTKSRTFGNGNVLLCYQPTT